MDEEVATSGETHDIARHVEIDYCRNGCMTFLKGSKSGMQTLCSKCKEPRFHRCSNRNCRTKPYSMCIHDVSRRIPRAQVFYRMLIPLVVDLILSKSFLTWLDAGTKDVYDGDVADDSLLHDIKQGPLYRQHEQEMHGKFRSQPGNELMTEVSLLLGEGYDGVKVQHWRSSHFWPMWLCVLNLPPHVRCMLGGGNFLGMLNVSSGQGVEESLLLDCLIPELIKLYEGFTLQLCGKTYFIQARLILHSLDTKGMEKLFRLGSSGEMGCFFCDWTVPGRYFFDHKKNYYVGHRVHLPLGHKLRYYGQSTKCCPVGFYELASTAEKEKRKVEYIRLKSLRPTDGFSEKKLRKIKPKTLKYDDSNGKFCLTCCGTENPEHEAEVKDLLFGGGANTPMVWNHLPIEDYMTEGICYYLHADYRPYVQFHRTSDKEFFELAELAKIENEPFGGIHDVCNLWNLPYALPSNLVWGPMHALGGMFDSLLGLWTTQDDIPSVNYCRDVPMQPSMFYRDKHSAQVRKAYDFALTSVDRHKMDMIHDACLYPPGTDDSRKMVNMFTHRSMTRTITKIYWMTHFMPVMLSFMSMPEPYRAVFNMISRDLGAICSNKLVKADLPKLLQQITELICIMEGVFPVHFMRRITHELLEITHGLSMLGPIHGWWEMASERNNGVIKRYMNPGGMLWERTGVRKYLEWELNKLKSIYNAVPGETREVTTSIDSNTCMEYDDSGCIRNFNSQIRKLDKPNGGILLNATELCQVLEILQNKLTPGAPKGKLELVWDHYSRKYRNMQVDILTWAESDDCNAEQRALLHKLRGPLTVFRRMNFNHTVAFKGRGPSFREEFPANDGRPCKECNNLRNTVFHKESYGTWVKLQEHDDDSKMCYGQFNAGFLLNFPDEPLLDGMQCAFVTCRKFERVLTFASPLSQGAVKEQMVIPDNYYREIVKLDDKVSYNPAVSVVCIDQIVPARFCVVPFTADLKPISQEMNKSATAETNNKRSKFGVKFMHNTEGIRCLDHLLMIELPP